MISLPRLPSRLSFALLLALALPLVAQPEAATMRSNPSQLPSIDALDFKGGTLADFLEAAKASGSSFNLVAHREHLMVAVPPFSVRNVEPAALAQALDHLLRSYGLAVSSFIGSPTSQPIFTVTATQRPHPNNLIHAFQLGPFLDSMPVEEIVSAIRTAWELTPGWAPDELVVKYHPGTKLLLVSGPREAVEMADLIVRRLAPNEIQPPAPEPGQSSDQRRRALDDVRQEIQERRAVRERPAPPPPSRQQ